MPKILSFKVTPIEKALIAAIVERAVIEGLCQKINKLNLSMDITATHANGCPIDLVKLAGAGRGDFYHDILGISRHLSHETGELGGCFLPRSAKREEVTA